MLEILYEVRLIKFQSFKGFIQFVSVMKFSDRFRMAGRSGNLF